MINCILLVLFLLVSMVLLKCTDSSLAIYFLNSTRLFHLWIVLIIILPVSLVIFFHFQFLMITLAKILFLLFLKLRMQIFLEWNYVTSLFTNISSQGTIHIAINLIFNPNSNLNNTKKEYQKLFLFATSQTHFIFYSNSFIINLIYNQIDGVAMGCLLAPVLAKIYMGFLELLS